MRAQPVSPARRLSGMRYLAAARAASLRHAALAAAALMALAGCASGVPAGARHTTASPPARVAATAAPLCTARALRLAGGREGTSETAIGFIQFTNTGARPCTLRGYPRLALIWHSRRLRVRDGRSGDLVQQAAVLAPGKADAAQLVVQWGNWCGRRARQLSVRITIPGTGTMTMPFNGPPDWDYTPQCVQPGAPSQLLVVTAYAS